jgi:hypothetical protein
MTNIEGMTNNQMTKHSRPLFRHSSFVIRRF